MTDSSSLDPEMRPPVAGAPASPVPARGSVDVSDVVRLMVGSPHVFAGTFPSDEALRGGARSLREMDMVFTTAQSLVGAGAAKSNQRRRRLALVVGALGVLAIGLSAGLGTGWYLAQMQAASVVPRADWRLEAVVPGAVVVRANDRLWPLRPGEHLPNGDTVIAVDDKTASVVSDSGVFRLAAKKGS